MSQILKVQTNTTLLPFLFASLEGWSKKTIKQRLQNATITVNGIVTTKHNFLLNPQDTVGIGISSKSTTKRLEVLYQDQEIIAIYKPSGLLSVSSTHEDSDHALGLLRKQLNQTKHSKQKPAIKLWPVHRLDRETSGVLLFATSKELRETIMDTWQDSEKIYLAIVEGTPLKNKDTISQALRLDEKEYRMHVGKHPQAKPAITHYTVKRTAQARSLLEVKIDTGRQHQIRAHLSWLGHSIIGDERYGTKGERMALHATKLTIIHPTSKKKISFEKDAPREFYALLPA